MKKEDDTQVNSKSINILYFYIYLGTSIIFNGTFKKNKDET